MLYQIICLLDTPPITDGEQHRCLHSPNRCWRLDPPSSRRNGRDADASASKRHGGLAGQESYAGGGNRRNGQGRGRGKAEEREEPAQAD